MAASDQVQYPPPRPAEREAVEAVELDLDRSVVLEAQILALVAAEEGMLARQVALVVLAS